MNKSAAFADASHFGSCDPDRDRAIKVDLIVAKGELEAEERKADKLRTQIEKLRVPSDIPAGCAVVAQQCEFFDFRIARNVVAHPGSIVYPATVPFPQFIPGDNRHRFLTSTSIFKRLLEQRAIRF